MDTEHILIINKSYGFSSHDYIQTKDGIVFSSNNNLYILKPLNESETKKLFIYAIQKHLLLNNFLNIYKILLTNDNHITIQLNDKKYYCESFHKGMLCNVENIEDVKKSVQLLAHMHSCATNFTPNRAIDLVKDIKDNDDFEKFIKYDLGNLETLFKHRTDELLRFKKNAVKSKGLFDYEYASIADYYHNIADNACAALINSGYASLCEEYSAKGTICHKDFNSHNVLFCEQAQFIMNFGSASIDLPILDLYNVLKQRMKKCGWSSDDAYAIINEYDKKRRISKTELEIIKILFNFPQKLWRVVNKYYNSRKSWCEKSCLAKLEDIKKERKKIEAFLKDIQ